MKEVELRELGRQIHAIAELRKQQSLIREMDRRTQTMLDTLSNIVFVSVRTLGLEPYDSGRYRVTTEVMRAYGLMDYSMEEFFEIVKSHGYGHVLKGARNVNGIVRAICTDTDGELPDWLEPVISVYEKNYVNLEQIPRQM